jgi:hypothetical protein
MNPVEVRIVISSPISIRGTVLDPDVSLRAPLIAECRSIAGQFAGLSAQPTTAEVLGALSGTVVPPPGSAPVAIFRHPKPLLHLPSFIQRPTAMYPCLNALRSGSYICTIIYPWPDWPVTVDIFKS